MVKVSKLVTLDPELVDEAKRLGLCLSVTLNNLLKLHLKQLKPSLSPDEAYANQWKEQGKKVEESRLMAETLEDYRKRMRGKTREQMESYLHFIKSTQFSPVRQKIIKALDMLLKESKAKEEAGE